MLMLGPASTCAVLLLAVGAKQHLCVPRLCHTRPQEAELQAAIDKATEAEARASEAEVRMKEARVRGHRQSSGWGAG